MSAPLGENFSNQDTEQPDVNKIKERRKGLSFNYAI